MEKVLYFNTGGGENAFRESLAYPVSHFMGYNCIDDTSLGMYFKPMLESGDIYKNDLIDLTITKATHQVVITAIQDEIENGTDVFATIADDDKGVQDGSAYKDFKLTHVRGVKAIDIQKKLVQVTSSDKHIQLYCTQPSKVI